MPFKTDKQRKYVMARWKPRTRLETKNGKYRWVRTHRFETKENDDIRENPHYGGEIIGYTKSGKAKVRTKSGKIKYLG